ncbi:unnamed protein product [Protopolystoma xenopodis]|uniref:Uncharacterized protein n=1 Tax=Protopolystoma xenopodis TaxID=117903 RepID=A0A448WYF2_9PLAT|nr:unnamed protein product [Protopolystoma xenopodis]
MPRLPADPNADLFGIESLLWRHRMEKQHQLMLKRTQQRTTSFLFIPARLPISCPRWPISFSLFFTFFTFFSSLLSCPRPRASACPSSLDTACLMGILFPVSRRPTRRQKRTGRGYQCPLSVLQPLEVVMAGSNRGRRPSCDWVIRQLGRTIEDERLPGSSPAEAELRRERRAEKADDIMSGERGRDEKNSTIPLGSAKTTLV